MKIFFCDGIKDDETIQEALDYLAESGENVVVVPNGFYRCGAKYSDTQLGENTRPYPQCCTEWWGEECYALKVRREQNLIEERDSNEWIKAWIDYVESLEEVEK